MKKIISTACLLALTSGCATAIPYSYKEECSFKEMKLHGVDSAKFVGSVGNGISADFNGTEDRISCVVPTSDEERCEVVTSQATAKPKYDYNDSIGTKRFITGVGYVAGIVPGIIAKILYENQKNNALKESTRMSQDMGLCSKDRMGSR